ncbi:MAG: hypothetical protein AB2558_12940 [Candidatus Thiodiazotropha sp.]
MGKNQWQDIVSSKPHELSDAKLEEFMQIAWTKTAGNMQVGNVYAALLSEKEARQNKSMVKRSLGLSILAVIFALFSLVFSVLDWQGDNDWQTSQLNELQNQSSHLMNIVNSLNKSPYKSLKSGTPKSGAP